MWAIIEGNWFNSDAISKMVTCLLGQRGSRFVPSFAQERGTDAVVKGAELDPWFLLAEKGAFICKLFIGSAQTYEKTAGKPTMKIMKIPSSKSGFPANYMSVYQRVVAQK